MLRSAFEPRPTPLVPPDFSPAQLSMKVAHPGWMQPRKQCSLFSQFQVEGYGISP